MKLQQAGKLLAATLPASQTPDLPQDILREENIPKDKVHALFLENEKAKNLYSKLSKCWPPNGPFLLLNNL
jgi:hypothetical protein